MNIAILALTAAVTVNFDSDIGRMRPELHSSGFGPQICSCPQESIDAIKSMGFKASRTHDWALINPNERVCDAGCKDRGWQEEGLHRDGLPLRS